MRPNEARKFHGHEDADGCEKCRKFRIPVRGVYHEGYADGYEAAQRERGPIQAVGKPLPPGMAADRQPHIFRDDGSGEAVCAACGEDPTEPWHIEDWDDDPRVTPLQHFASETPQGRPGS